MLTRVMHRLLCQIYPTSETPQPFLGVLKFVPVAGVYQVVALWSV